MALIEATSRLFFKDTRKAEARSFINANRDNVASLQRVKEVLMSEYYGIRTWVASYGVVDFKITIGLKRLQRDIEYPYGRMIMADSEVEWSNVKNLLTQIPKTHSFYDLFSRVYIVISIATILTSLIAYHYQFKGTAYRYSGGDDGRIQALWRNVTSSIRLVSPDGAAYASLSANVSSDIFTPTNSSSMFIFSAIKNHHVNWTEVYVNTWTRRLYPLPELHCCFALDIGRFISAPVEGLRYYLNASLTARQFKCILPISVPETEIHFITIVRDRRNHAQSNNTALTNTTQSNQVATQCARTPLGEYIQIDEHMDVPKRTYPVNHNSSVLFKSYDDHENTTTPKQQTMKTNSKLILKITENKTYSFAICGKIAYGEFRPSLVIEWFEYYKRMGVTTVLLWTYNLTDVSAKVLDFYANSGILQLMPFDFPRTVKDKRRMGDKNHQGWNDEHVTVLDCQERLRNFKYVGVIDHDEFIVPKMDANFEGLFNRLHRMTPWAGSFQFSNDLHLMNFGSANNTTDDLVIRSHPNFTRANLRTKNVYMPSRTKHGAVSTHFVKSLPGFKATFKVPPEVAVINHYRQCCSRKWGKMDACKPEESLHDNDIAKHVDAEFRQNVKQIEDTLLN